MQAPKLPSFFKIYEGKRFSFKPRYYNKQKEQLKKEVKANIKFNRKHTRRTEKGRSIQIIFLIIILSLLAYKFIIN